MNPLEASSILLMSAINIVVIILDVHPGSEHYSTGQPFPDSNLPMHTKAKILRCLLLEAA